MKAERWNAIVAELVQAMVADQWVPDHQMMRAHGSGPEVAKALVRLIGAGTARLTVELGNGPSCPTWAVAKLTLTPTDAPEPGTA